MSWTAARQGVRMLKFLSILNRYEASEFSQLEAAELLGVVHRRGALIPGGALSPSLRQYDPITGWTVRPVPTAERPPAVSEPSYAGGRLEVTR